MRFQDPASVECPVCGQTAEQSVRSLLRLEASCPHCGAGFQEQGRKMREFMEDVWLHFEPVLILCELKDLLGLDVHRVDGVSGRELCATRTLRELTAFLGHRFPEVNDDQLERAIRVAEVGANREASVDIDAPLLDAMRPDRWSGDDAWWTTYP